MDTSTNCKYKIGDRVLLLKDICEQGEDLPTGIIARKEEVMIVRGVPDNPNSYWDLYVSHDYITDRSFGVKSEEVELYQEQTQFDF